MTDERDYPILTEAEIEEEERLHWIAIQKDAMCEAIGRVVLGRIAAFDKAADENSDPADLGAVDVLKWLAQELPGEHRKMFAEETGYNFDEGDAAPKA